MGGYVNRWRCLDAPCTEHGQGTISEVNRQSEKHQTATGHSTLTWTEVPLPIPVPRE